MQHLRGGLAPPCFPKARTTYGIVNIGFQCALIWNDMTDDIGLLPLKHFEKNLKLILLKNY